MEVWVDVEGFENFYQVSNYGNVRSLDRNIVQNNGVTRLYRGRVLKPKVDKYGYQVLTLSKRTQGIRKTITIHKLVAQAFILNPFHKDNVNHINGCKSDNNVNNLEWVTCSENTTHAINEGLIDIEASRVRMRRMNEANKIKVKQIKDGRTIRVYNSIQEALESVANRRTGSIINECCRGKRKSAYGYEWRYAN
ncbi:ribosomal protein L19 [Paenibacillus sp. PastF-3]|uniref:NUMOD4 domain-containing protein n=1 Tax=Paenibacillus sp. PastF-3 TaxID=2940626 RepID=UPI00247714A5|nr:NUMOD4 domain-containing protein [Paenibacillus sp. PastF-3]MDH6371760.1 ribosomal protein L19 [Paenibacillus sp. PastF-3]